MRPASVTIVGGGLVGSLLAVLLARRGYAIRVFEKRPDMRRVAMSAGRSINLALAERGIKALRLAGLMDEVGKILIPMRGRMLHEIGQSLEFSPYGQREHEVIYSVSRGLLNQTMLSAAESASGTNIHFECECQSADFDRREVRIRDRTGNLRTYSFDFLIGTDGAGSVVRDAVVRDAGGEWRMEWLDHDYKELNLPPDAAGRHQLERNALHIWPRHGYMLIALPNLDGSFTVTLFLNKVGNPSFQSLLNRPAVEGFFRDQFPDAHQLIPDLADQFFENPTGNLGTIRATQWFNPKGPALLMGDAAHAVVPFHGQGMNAGFEDCGEWLRLLDKHNEDWLAAAQEFALIRPPNANAIADMALENYVTMRDSVLDSRFQLKKLLGFALERELPDTFIPKYSMVMFRDIPYAVVKRRGEIQEGLLEQSIGGLNSLEQVNLSRAADLVRQRLRPIGEEPTA